VFGEKTVKGEMEGVKRAKIEKKSHPGQDSAKHEKGHYRWNVGKCTGISRGLKSWKSVVIQGGSKKKRGKSKD